MKLKQLSLLLMLSISIITYANSPTKKGFSKMNSIYSTAIDKLNGVKTNKELTEALEALGKLEKKASKDTQIDIILSLSAVNCPREFKGDLEKLNSLQSELKDAGKRLAMGGILQDSFNANAYNKFATKFIPSSLQEEAPINEGAPYETKEARDVRMKWWRDGKFGMFVHYGLYSGLAGEVNDKKYEGCVEWIQMQSGLDSDTYAKEAMPKFTPKEGKATQWVKLAKESGCKYIVMTSRHHEGYNMFDTKHSEFNIMNTKGINIADEYAKACEQYDIKAGYYFSLIDWSHPDYDPTGSGISYPKGNYEAQKRGERTFGNHEKYKEYLLNLFSDLTSNYKVDLMWWDFSQPRFQGDKAWGATNLMRKLFDVNPKAIQNNRLYHSDNHISEGGIKVTPTWKGDYSTAEHHIPATGIDGDWEACQTLNGTWGYSAENQKWKSSDELIRQLIDVVSRGGNFLLNIGPEADGTIPAESIRLFNEIGAWMNVNNQAIYETRANPFDVEFKWGRVTRKGDDTLYILVYEKPENGVIHIPCTFAKRTKAVLLDGGESVAIKNLGDNTTEINISNMTIKPGASVIKITGNYSK
ncbi:MAG: alpha-L-fucosidase [Bacteroidales bacterium]